MNFQQLLLPAIEHFHIIGYWIVFLAALLETTFGIGLFIPGSTIILFMGALAAKGYFDLGDLLWFAAIGAVLGDNINYFIGKKYGFKFFKNDFWFFKTAYLKKGKEFFKKHGSKSVFIGRFIPSIKEVMPLIAGTFGMKKLPFAVWNILGAIGWSLAWVLSGYFFAQSLNLAKTWLTRAGFFLVVLLAVFMIFYILKVVLNKKGKAFFEFLSSVWQSIKQAVLGNPNVQELVNRHKNFFIFFQNRLNKNSFFGLPLTLLFLALVYALFLLGGVIEDIINSDIIVSADIHIANLMAVFRNAGVTKFFFWVTFLGKWQVILIFTAATLIILWIWKRRLYILPLLISIVGSEIFTSAGKFIFHRSRPAMSIYNESSFSFPSGHATIAVAVYGFVSYILIRNIREWKMKINIFFTGSFIIILIGFSRLYLGVHYLSDVWGGYLVGAIWLIIGISISEYFLYKKPRVDFTANRTKKILLSFAIVFFSIFLYIIFAVNYQVPILSVSQESNQIIVNEVSEIFDIEKLKYTEDLLGSAQEPLSFVIISKNDSQLVNLFGQAGWTLADDTNVPNIVRLAFAVLRERPYPNAPMTPSFWNTKVHNFGFEKATASNNVSSRHHARFWRTNYITEDKENVYVGTASFDSAIKWGVTHQINPDIDTEREFLFDDLQKTDMIIKKEKLKFVDPRLGSNFSGDLFFTDGDLYLISTKQ